jgi:[acyl-carrier-protein] S-malonyltransferase
MIAPEASAFIFPGQGSQKIGMGRDLAEEFSIARERFEEADQILGYSISKIAWEGPESELNDTIHTQPALFVHSVAVLEVFWQEYPGFRPAYVAGHSMGELSALVAAGAAGFSDTLKLVRRRGELMKMAGEISPGAMAAVLGLDIPALERICQEASIPGEIVQVANDNCPGQVVISGAKAALERAIRLAEQAGARRVRLLAVSIAAHSPLMHHAQEEFNLAVQAAPITDPRIELIGNVTALPLRTSLEIRSDLQAQLNSRVRWTESIQEMIRRGVTTFLELGSGSVLTGLVQRIDSRAVALSIGTPADFDKLTQAIK